MEVSWVAVYERTETDANATGVLRCFGLLGSYLLPVFSLACMLGDGDVGTASFLHSIQPRRRRRADGEHVDISLSGVEIFHPVTHRQELRGFDELNERLVSWSRIDLALNSPWERNRWPSIGKRAFGYVRTA